MTLSDLRKLESVLVKLDREDPIATPLRAAFTALVIRYREEHPTSMAPFRRFGKWAGVL